MEFDIRRVGKYKNVEVEIDNQKIHLGFQDLAQCKVLAQQLLNASEGLLQVNEEISDCFEKINEWMESEL